MKKLLCLILLFVFLSGLSAQEAVNPADANHFDMTGFPQWTKDIRRGSIVMLGVFPFTIFFSTIAYDTYRYANHDWDIRYAPWPIRPAGAIQQTQGEMFMMIGYAAAGAFVVAVVDHAIERSKRNRLAREASELAPGTPIIIRRSVNEPEAVPDVSVDIENDIEAPNQETEL